jgi:hypothetical protein
MAIILKIIAVIFLFMLIFFVYSYVKVESFYKAVLNQCKSLNGTFFIYALDQTEHLCLIEDKIIDLKTMEEWGYKK